MTIELEKVPDAGHVTFHIRTRRTLFDKAATGRVSGVSGPGRLTASSDSVDPNPSTNRFIGAFQKRRHTIAAFIDQNKASRLEAVVPIFEMPGIVRAIHYFPAADTAAGTVTTLQTDSAGATISWFDVSR